MRFCCWCFKLSKKIEKLLNEQSMNAITKCTLAGLVQYAKKSHQKWDLRSCIHIYHHIASSFHCHTCRLEFKKAAGTSGKKYKRLQPAWGKYRFTNSGLRFTPKSGDTYAIIHLNLTGSSMCVYIYIYIWSSFVYIIYTHRGPPFISSKGLSVSLSLITLYNRKITHPESGHPCRRHHGRACPYSLSSPVGWKSKLWSWLVNFNPEPTSGRKTIHWRLVDGRHFQRK